MNLSNRSHLFLLLSIVTTSFWFSGGALLGLLLLLLSFTSGKVIYQNQHWQSYSLTTLMLIYLAWILIVSVMSPLTHLQVITMPVLASLPVMYLVASHSTTLKENWSEISYSVFILGVVFALWAIFQVYFKVGFYGHAVGPLSDRNTFAALLNFFWFTTIYLLFNNWKNAYSSQCSLRRLATLLGLLIISIAFFATKSRGGLLVFLLLTPFLVWSILQFTKLKKTALVVVLIPCIAYLISTYLFDSSVATRNFNLSQDSSVSGRLMLWQASIQMALNHPFFGSGWGTFVSYYPAYRDPLENTSSGFFAHNDYLQFALEGGFLALALIIGIFLLIVQRLFYSLKQASQEKGFEQICLLLGVLAIFIQASVNYIFYFGFMNLFAGLYLARVSQLSETPTDHKLIQLTHIRASVKRFFVYSVLFLASAPLLIHLFSLGMFGGSQPLYNLIYKVQPKINLYNLANFITAIRPSEYVAQFYILKSNELYLNDKSKFEALTEEEQREFLVSTISLFESVANRMAMDANLGVRQVKLLMQYRNLYDSKLQLGERSAFDLAHHLLDRNLTVNRSHAESIILKSRLFSIEGRLDEAIKNIKTTQNQLIGKRDKLLVRVELLRLYANPNQLAELDKIEQSVIELTQFGTTTIEQVDYRENQFKLIDSKLNDIATLEKAH